MPKLLCFLLLLTSLPVLASSQEPTQDRSQSPLPRRIALGVQVKPVSVDTQQRLKLRNTRGVEVVSVVPDSTASAVGLKPGDVILALRDQPVQDVASFVEQVASTRAGAELPIKLQRTDGPVELKADPKPLPYESSDEFDVQYSEVTTPVGRLRTVLTVPKTAAKTSKVPGVLLLSGLGLGSVEHPAVDPLGMKAMAQALTNSGLAVMRVDRPGCGDSEGGPARDADFNSVVAGYVAAAQALKQHARVDPEQITLLGFSAGALEAPLVAAKVPVKNIAIYGCLSLNWQEYLQSTTRRQLRIAGASAGDIEQHVAAQSAAWHYLIYEGMSPDDIAGEHDELSEWVDENWVDGKYFSGIHYSFFQQLGKTNIAAAWDQFDGRVLAMWGDLDIVTSKEEHEFIAEIANRKQAGRGIFQIIPGVDHNLRMPSQTDTPGNASSPKPIIEPFIKWIGR